MNTRWAVGWLVVAGAGGAITAIVLTLWLDPMTVAGLAVAAITVPVIVRYIVTGSPFPHSEEEHD